jgi:succinyl-diaminopimelate desuccinylase
MRDSISRRPTLVMGGNVTGGVKVNVVPGEATFSIDRRVIPEESILKATEEILEIVRRFNKKYKDSKAYVKFMAAGEPAISKKNKNFFETVSRAVGKVTGKSAKFCLLPGATDVRYFMWKGIPSLGYSARGGESWHSDNEFVYIDSLVDTAKVFMLVMSGLE